MRRCGNEAIYSAGLQGLAVTIFKACDVRGVVGQEWGADEARRIGRSLGRMIRTRGDASVCVGGDFRRSTPPLKQEFVEGLLEAGLAIYDVGQQPTPLVYFAARQLGCRSVAVVTASHNPARYNGIKFLVAGQPAVPQLVRELEAGCTTVPPAAPRGTVICHYFRAAGETESSRTAFPGRHDGPEGPSYESNLSAERIAAAYEEWVIRRAGEFVVPAPSLRLPPLSVVLDAMAGACTHIAPRVLARAGATVTALTPAIDPDFSERTPNPARDENLAPLIEAVVERDSDVGIAPGRRR